MNAKTKEETAILIDKATSGDEKALESLVLSVQDLVFNLSLRMLGTFHDAEDAAQEIMLKIITHLSAFQKESSFSTWVFRIAANHLKDYKKSMFAQRPLSFEFYGEDIQNGAPQELPDLSQGIDKELLAEELKLSCTNVMLQCLDTESRCIFILGTMFHVDSRIAGEILSISPEAYRQKLSRVRKKMADFLETYCGAYGSGTCKCKNRIHYAVASHRLHPDHLEYTSAVETLQEIKNAMEEVDGLAGRFHFCKPYQSPESIARYIRRFLESTQVQTIMHQDMEAN